VFGLAPEDEGAGRPMAACLRLSRDGATLSADLRHADGEWQHLAQRALGDATALEVGVWAGGSDGPFTAEFEDFKLTPLK
jgi:regulation of enolase protein 1 (concanavalin A-like superfamily)